MRRNRRLRITFIFLMSFILVLSTMSACENKTKKIISIKPEYTPSSASEKVKEIVEAESLKQSTDAVKEALALGGIGTADLHGWEYEPLEPAATALVIPYEAYNLAMEARERASIGTITLEEFGQMLNDFKFPFPEETTPSEFLMRFLSAWVTEAESKLEDSSSFTPIFLAEMTKLQDPPIDLAAGNYDPIDLRLSLLELQLFLGAFDRAFRPEDSEVVPFQATAYGKRRNVAYADDPCSRGKEWLGELGGDVTKVLTEVGQVGLGEGIGFGIGKALEAAGFTKAETSHMGNALTALGTISKLAKLVSIYKNAQIHVTVESDNPLHKALKSEPKKYTAFKAQVGISDKDWEDYENVSKNSEAQQALKDCFNLVGLPTIPDLGDVAKETKDWTVEWDILKGSPEHALISLDVNDFYLKGRREMKLQPDGKHSASATFVLELTPEKAKKHEGEVKSAPVTVRGQLDTSSMPSLSTFVNAGKGLFSPFSLADSMYDILSGWFQSMVKPSSVATLTVTYHDPQWKGKITAETIAKYKLAETYPGASHHLDINSGYKLELDLGETTSTVENKVDIAAKTRTTGSFSLVQTIKNPACNAKSNGTGDVSTQQTAKISIEQPNPEESKYLVHITPPSTIATMQATVTTNCPGQPSSKTSTNEYPLEYFRDGTTIEIDAKNPEQITGSQTFEQHIGNGTIIEVISWDLNLK